jgi:glutamate carboxypeptidase
MLAWIDRQQGRMLEMVRAWARISSWSLDPARLAAMHRAASEAFASVGSVERVPGGTRAAIGDDGRETTTPLGDAVRVRGGAGPAGSPRVLLGIHMDTVYPPSTEPPRVELAPDGAILRGPGVTDAKGGLVVMLVALESFTRFGPADRLRWEVFINADEELGSPGSAPLLAEAAARNDVGLLFEPALDEAGTLAGARKGSGNFTVVIRGRAAHAGRHFAEGRNAVAAAARLATACHALNDSGRGVTVNVAALHGGEGFNVVPDLAVLRLNARVATAAEADWLAARLAELVAEANAAAGFSASLQGGFHCPPKPFDGPTRGLFDRVRACGDELGLTLIAEPTGGVCDGNKLAAAGLPTLDTLGVRGGGIHSPDEYLVVASLAERAKLTALVLADLAERGLPAGVSNAGRGCPCQSSGVENRA